MKRIAHEVIHSSSFYPISTVWLVSCLVGILVTNGTIRTGVGVTLVTVIAVLAMVVASWRELARIRERTLTTDRLLDRVEHMIDLLEDEVPPPSAHRRNYGEKPE